MDSSFLAYMHENRRSRIITLSVICVIILVVVIVAVVKFKGLGTKIADAKANKKLVDDLDSEIKTEQITLTQAQFNSFASTLYKAMKGIGTNEQKIYEVFRNMETRSDVLQLIKTFGIKDGETLNEWLQDDLSASEIDKVNQILAGNGINYKF